MLLPDDPARAFVPYPAVAVPRVPGGPLDGLTFAVKDLVDVAGYPTGGGSPHVLALSGIKERTAPAVTRFLAAGATFVGKTHTDELAFSLNGRNAHFGTPVNGAAPDRVPGGSSSGSASAVSNGLCDIALGTDTGGSVRTPASHCGLFGVRPTHGRVSLEGIQPLAASFDTVGVFARAADLFVRAATVLLGEDRGAPVGPFRLLQPQDVFAGLGDGVRDALAPALAAIEAALGPAEAVTVAEGGFEAPYWAIRRIQAWEAWQAHGAFITRHRPPLGPGVAERFAYGAGVSVAELDEAEAVRRAVTASLRGLLGTDRVLVLPTMPDVAPRLSQDEADLDAYRNRAIEILCLAGLAGLPQVTMPLASREGAPLGVSLLGPAGTDLALVRLAAEIAGRRAIRRPA